MELFWRGVAVDVYGNVSGGSGAAGGAPAAREYDSGWAYRIAGSITDKSLDVILALQVRGTRPITVPTCAAPFGGAILIRHCILMR